MDTTQNIDKLSHVLSLVKQRVYGFQKDTFFYLYTDAQYCLKFPARVEDTFPVHLRYNDVISAKDG